MFIKLFIISIYKSVTCLFHFYAFCLRFLSACLEQVLHRTVICMCICVYTYICICVCECMYICICMHVGQMCVCVCTCVWRSEDRLRCYSSGTIHLKKIETVSLIGLELTKSPRLPASEFCPLSSAGVIMYYLSGPLTCRF